MVTDILHCVVVHVVGVRCCSASSLTAEAASDKQRRRWRIGIDPPVGGGSGGGRFGLAVVSAPSSAGPLDDGTTTAAELAAPPATEVRIPWPDALPKHYQAQHCSTDPSRRRARAGPS